MSSIKKFSIYLRLATSFYRLLTISRLVAIADTAYCNIQKLHLVTQWMYAFCIIFTDYFHKRNLPAGISGG